MLGSFVDKVKRQKAVTAVFFLALIISTVATILIYKNASAAAATCYWVGDTSPAAWNDATHWSNADGGAGSTCDGGVVPGSDDTVIFNSTNTNSADVDMAASISAFTINAGYTGTIAIAAGNSLTAAGAFTLHDGVFTTNDQTVTLNSTYTQDGGVLNAGASAITIKRDFTKSAGTINEGTSTFNFNNSGFGRTIQLSGTETFYNVAFNRTSAYGDVIATGSTLVVDGTLTLTNGGIDGPGIINANGTTVTQAATFDGGNVRLNLANDAVVQTYTIEGGVGPYLYLDSAADASDSVVFNAPATLYGINITSDFSGTVPITDNGNNITLTASFTLAANVTFDKQLVQTGAFTQSNGTFTAIPGTLTVTSDFTKSGGTFNEGTGTILFQKPPLYGKIINLNGSEEFHNVTFNGSASWYWEISAGTTMVVNGTLSFIQSAVNGPGIIDAMGNVYQAATATEGTVRVNFANDAVAQTYTIDGGSGPYLYLDSAADANDSVIFNAPAILYGLNITSDFSGTVPITDNDNDIKIWFFTLDANTTFDQQLIQSSAFTQSNGTFSAVPGTLTFTGNFTKTGGIFNEGTGTVSFNATYYRALDIVNAAPETFYNVIFNSSSNSYGYAIATGDTIVVDGTLSLTNGYINGPGIVDANGAVTNASTFDGGSAPLILSGSGDQEYSIAGVPMSGVLLLNKDTGLTTLSNSSTTARTLTLSSAAQKSGGLVINTSGTGGLTLAGATNNPNVTLTGGLSFGKTSTGVPALTMGTATAWSATGDVNFTNATVTAGTSTLTLGGAAAQSLTTASQSLNNLTVTNASASGVTLADSATVTGIFTDITPSSKLTFDALSTFAFANININGQANGTKITMVSNDPANPDLPSRQWYFNVTQVSPQTSYVNVTDSDALGGNLITSLTGTDGGNNENWAFGTIISGTVFTAEDESTNIDANKTVALSINGAAATTVETTAGGVFEFGAIFAADNTIAVFLDGETEKASLVTQAADGTTDITGLKLYTGHIVLSHNTAGPMTNTLLATADNVADTDLLISVDGSNIATFTTGNEVWIIAGKAYTPGANVNAGSVEILATATFSPENNTIALNDSGTPFTVGGTFNQAGSTIVYKGSAATNVTGTTYNNLTIDSVDANVHKSEVTVTNGSGGVLTNYQVKITLSGANFDFANSTNDGRDIRIYAADDTTPLDFYIESWDQGTEAATIWVKIPSLATGDSSIFLHYGDSSLVSQSDGAAVFPFFDDFPGSTLDTAKWPTHQGEAVSGGYLTVDVSTANVSTEDYVFAEDYIVPIGSIVEMRTKSVATNSIFRYGITTARTIFYPSGTYIGVQQYSDGRLYTDVGSGGAGTQNNDAAYDTNWHTFAFSWATNFAKFTRDGTDIRTYVTNVPAGSAELHPYIRDNGQADWVRVRAYASTEPTTSVGAPSSVPGNATMTAAGSITVSGVLNIAAGTFDAADKTITLSGNGTPLVKTGTFTASTSTIKYQGTGATNITAANYYILELSPPSGTPTYTLASGTINTTSNFTNGDGVNALTANATTNDTIVNIDGSFTNSTGATFVASDSASFSIASNYTNNGIFTDSGGTLVLDGQGLQTITAGGTDVNHNFHNLTVTNASVAGVSFADSATVSGTFTDTTQDSKLTFADGATYTFANITINGASGHRITMTKGAGANGHWYFNVSQVSPTVTYVAVDNSDATGSSGAISDLIGGVNNGGNINWTFATSVPNAPTIGAPQAISSTSIRWTFTDNDTNEAGFKVYDGSNTLKVTCEAPDLTYCDETGLSVNTLYSDRYVVAYNDIGDSVPSATAAGIYTLANVPTAPTVNVTSDTSLTIIINVNSNPASTEFAISCDADATFLNYTTNACEAIVNDANHWRTYANWGGTSGFTDTGLLVDTSHTYKVMARNGDLVETALSSGTTATTSSVKTWSALAAGNWETAANWTPAGAPEIADIVIFDATSTQNCTVTTYTGVPGGMGIADAILSISVNSGYTGTINFQKKPSQNADPFKVNLSGDFTINSGTVITEGDVTVQHGGITDGRGNEFVVANLTVGAGASFHANGKGFAQNTGPGYSGSSYPGSSYGGDGGASAFAGRTYGDYSNPVSLGSGGFYNSFGTPPTGGGAVVVVASADIVVNGTISANGIDNDYAGSGGSGGSVNLTANAISGAASGSISANGGAGGGYGAGQSGAGGGRIKLESTTTITLSGSVLAKGGQGASNMPSGSAGTIYKKVAGQTYGDLILDNGTTTPPDPRFQQSAHLKASDDTGSYQFDNLTFANYGRLGVDTGQSLALDYGVVSGSKTAGVVNAGTVTTPTPWTLNYYYSNKNGTITGLASKDVTISSSGFLTHYPNDTTEAYKINWSIPSLTVQVGGEINVDNEGYAPENGPGYSAGVGTSYGGDGGNSAFGGKTYGDFSNPTSLGSGGWYYAVNQTPTAGGGAVIITTSGNIVVDGSISANALYNGYRDVAGSGGSVNLTGNAISGGGSGVITANGGAGGGYAGGYSGSGGGRIKLESTTTITLSGSVLAKGGEGANNNPSGSAGTIYKKVAGQTYGDLILDNGSTTPPSRRFQEAAHLKTSDDAGSYQFDSITFSNYGRLGIDTGQAMALDYGVISGSKTAGVVNAGTVTTPTPWTLNYYYSNKNGTITGLASKNITISSAGFLTHFPNTDAETYKINWTVPNLTVEVGGEINVDNVGYAPENGPGYSGGNIGTSHGGEGAGADVSKVYGDYSNPISLGSGGWIGGVITFPTGGGGAIIITTTGNIVVDGSISADALDNDWHGIAGSGGSVNLTANAISGAASGSISANGGAGGGYVVGYSGAAGGRVKIESATTIALAGTVFATGGMGNDFNFSGAAGTIYYKTAAQIVGDLVIDNTAKGVTTAYTPLPAPKSFDSLTIRNYGQFRLDTNADHTLDTLDVAGDINLTSNAIMRLVSDFDGTPDIGRGMHVTTENMYIDASSLINSNNSGFIHDQGYSNGQGLVGVTYGGGGGFGGAGGASSDGGAGGQTYGGIIDVLYDGSGGGAANLGGQAGGQMYFYINDVFSNAGWISADGADGTTNGGGGSGGGIKIVTNHCEVSGNISVDGGNGAAGGGGGGGGRILLIANGVCGFTDQPTAAGGIGGGGGGDGTDGTVAISDSSADSIAVAPLSVTLCPAESAQLSAVAYDQFGFEISGASFVWSVVAGGGTIDQNGIFTAGSTPGTYPNTIRAAIGSVYGYAGATVASGCAPGEQIGDQTTGNGSTTSGNQPGDTSPWSRLPVSGPVLILIICAIIAAIVTIIYRVEIVAFAKRRFIRQRIR